MCSTDIDVDPIRKADLEREIDLRQRLQTRIELLESEKDKYRKTDAAQKASIKKLTRDNDSLKTRTIPTLTLFCHAQQAVPRGPTNGQ